MNLIWSIQNTEKIDWSDYIFITKKNVYNGVKLISLHTLF